MGALDKLYFIGFLYVLAATTLVTLLFLGWWVLNRGLRTWEKLLGLVIIVGEAWLVGRYSHRSINYFGLWLSGVPLVATAIVAWLFLVKKFQISSARLGFVVVVSLVWGHFLLIRDDGTDSRLKTDRHWRWTPTSEEQFLSKSNASLPAKGPSPNTNELLTAKASSGDWTCFRGINRDGVIRATMIATNWNLHPPVQIWKHAVGPAWSSLLVVGNRIFTQEQRGENESVVCYDATTGSELWVHTDTARFEESVSGPGPRATPTFADGKLYALGGTGILNCLEATTGKTLWKRDIKEASEAKVPMWAFSSSPLVTDGLVVVYAGGEAGKGLLAYHQETGELAWAAGAGTSSYSSPQLTVIDGVPQCLMLHDGGLTAVEITSGNKLWETGLPMKGAPRCGQPRLIEDNKLLVGTLGFAGCSLIEVSKGADTWTITKRWETRDLKPEFPDFVVHRGYAYGFDVGIFCCIKVADGKRAWKDGRYGRGQVMLLADQDALLVTSETGELVLLAADSNERRELGKFQALAGKTWNHPVVRGDRVYLRNAEEMGCYAIPEKPGDLAIQN
jgi:outer membrane protein assembly factor BamB